MRPPAPSSRLAVVVLAVYVCLPGPPRASSAQFTEAARKYVANRVQVSAEAGKIDNAGRQAISLSLQIEKGWHLLANPSGLPDLERYETRVTVEGKGVSAVKVVYPRGIEVEDEVLGKWKKYEGKVGIRIELQRDGRAGEPVEIRVRHWPQETSKFCGIPVTKTIRVR